MWPITQCGQWRTNVDPMAMCQQRRNSSPVYPFFHLCPVFPCPMPYPSQNISSGGYESLMVESEEQTLSKANGGNGVYSTPVFLLDHCEILNITNGGAIENISMDLHPKNRRRLLWTVLVSKGSISAECMYSVMVCAPHLRRTIAVKDRYVYDALELATTLERLKATPQPTPQPMATTTTNKPTAPEPDKLKQRRYWKNQPHYLFCKKFSFLFRRWNKIKRHYTMKPSVCQREGLRVIALRLSRLGAYYAPFLSGFRDMSGCCAATFAEQGARIDCKERSLMKMYGIHHPGYTLSALASSVLVMKFWWWSWNPRAKRLSAQQWQEVKGEECQGVLFVIPGGMYKKRDWIRGLNMEPLEESQPRLIKQSIVDETPSRISGCPSTQTGWHSMRRFCVDYRALNEVPTKGWGVGSNLFTGLDLKFGYWQVDLTAEARRARGPRFVHALGCTLPFRLMNVVVLARLMPLHCMVYIDDVVIFPKGTFEEHLGWVDKSGLRAPDPGKVIAVNGIQTPTNTAEIRKDNKLPDTIVVAAETRSSQRLCMDVGVTKVMLKASPNQLKELVYSSGMDHTEFIKGPTQLTPCTDFGPSRMEETVHVARLKVTRGMEKNSKSSFKVMLDLQKLNGMCGNARIIPKDNVSQKAPALQSDIPSIPDYSRKHYYEYEYCTEHRCILNRILIFQFLKRNRSFHQPSAPLSKYITTAYSS
ncbi:hypothetical protein Pelo_4311 [Pelomyxa schiedti]|nr:hypothetical protein Pelo_4311 [Pelomyxa schiedti]